MARWMVKVIYTLKMYLFRTEFFLKSIQTNTCGIKNDNFLAIMASNIFRIADNL